MRLRLGRAVPDAGPSLIGPAQAERKVRRAACDHLVEGALEQTLAGEPVVVIAKSCDAVLSCELRLLNPGLRDPEVVKPEIGRHVRLIVPGKPPLRLRQVGPLGEALAPPGVVLGDRVVLRKIVGEDAGAFDRSGWHGVRAVIRSSGADAQRETGISTKWAATRHASRQHCSRRLTNSRKSTPGARETPGPSPANSTRGCPRSGEACSRPI